FFSSRRRHTRFSRDWSSDVCSSDLYYFHQFPVWFLLANLVGIPLSFVILVTGLVTLAAAIWPAAAMVCGYALHGAVWLLNRSVELTADLPLSVIDGIYISSFQCWILGC